MENYLTKSDIGAEVKGSKNFIRLATDPVVDILIDYLVNLETLPSIL